MQQPKSFRERCLEFSAAIWTLTQRLPRTRAGRHVADQLLRSGTSVGANVYEARAAESRADFIHKMQVALKEAREAYFWLSLIQKAKVGETGVDEGLLQECDEITAILIKSAMTARKNGTAEKPV
jgi:four helix bundle protein